MSGVRTTVGTVVVLGVLASAACSPAAVAPGPVPSSMTAPPLSPTPTETAQERQERLDYAAAEKSYRTFRAEYNRVLRAGGAKKPTKVMKATAGGSYLEALARIVEAYDGVEGRDEGGERIVFVRHVGHSAEQVSLEVCEDGGRITTIFGSKRIAGEVRMAELEVRKVGGAWKVWSGEGRKVRACD